MATTIRKGQRVLPTQWGECPEGARGAEPKTYNPEPAPEPRTRKTHPPSNRRAVAVRSFVYWFRRPPYSRWTAAVLVVTGALCMDLRGDPTELRPFAATDIAAGAAIRPEMVEYRAVPTGLLPEVNLVGFTLNSIPAGDPVTQALITDRSAVPDGWWALEMEAPSGVIPGTELRLAIEADAGTPVPAVVLGVVSPEVPGGWSENTALVAVPSDRAATVATALARAAVSVLVVEW